MSIETIVNKPQEEDPKHALYFKIVEQFDKAALATYLTENKQRLAFFANRVTGNKWPLDDLEQEISLNLLELQVLAQKGETGSFCKIYQSFNSWASSVARTTADRRFKIAGPLQYIALSTTEDHPEDEASIGQNYIPDMPEGLYTQTILPPETAALRKEEQILNNRILRKILDREGVPETRMMLENARKCCEDPEECGAGKTQRQLSSEYGLAVSVVNKRIKQQVAALVTEGLKPEFI
ncbi:MAG: hypothetical protein RBR86_05910 [Pseudobdellovibrionaceae bacterium]|jgi:hypothetical protein|nr:hypothetical protein [Pseudobdellovibrionaceae bacterium]